VERRGVDQLPAGGSRAGSGVPESLRDRPFAENDMLSSRLIEQLYRGDFTTGEWVSFDQYPGGLAGAIRREISKGELVGGTSHKLQGEERLQRMKEILRTGAIPGQALSV
jgi:hypothetical protein